MDINKLVLAIPLNTHPVMAEKIDLKKKYIKILKYYLNKYNQGGMYSHKIFIEYMSFFKLNDDDIKEIEVLTNKELKKIIRKIKIRKYGFVFIIDCIFIIALNNEELAKKIANDFKQNICKIYHKRIDSLLKAMFTNLETCKALKYPEMLNYWNKNVYSFYSERNKILVTATMSAGKSSLINAFAGKEILQSKNEACTALGYNVANKLIEDNMIAVKVNEELILNAEKSYLKGLNNTKYMYENINMSTYFNLSTNSRKSFIIIDSPGVNSSLNKDHKKIFNKIYENGDFDKILYVINAENCGTNDEHEHITKMTESAKDKQIIFVINKLDSFNLEDDSINEIMQNIRNYLINIGFSKPILCPVSAKAGMV